MATSTLENPTTRTDLRDPNLTVSDVMRTDIRSCNTGTPVAEAATAIRLSGEEFLAVTRSQVPIGIVTAHALAAALAEHGGDLSRVTAGDLMMADPATIAITKPLDVAANRLAEAGGHLLAVNSDGQFQGVVTLAELGPQLSEIALGRLVARLAQERGVPGSLGLGDPRTRPGRSPAPAEAARGADPTAEVKSGKSQDQPHPWDSPTHDHPAPIPLVSESDLVNPMLKVADVMTSSPRTCSPSSTILEAVLIFRDAECGLIPVVEDGRPVGVLTDRDVALALAEHEGAIATINVSMLMTENVEAIKSDATLDSALDRLGDHGLRRLLVVDSSGRLVGVLSAIDLAPHISERGAGRVLRRIAEHRSNM